MKNYYRLMLGKQSKHAPLCFAGGFIGADFDIEQDLTADLPDDWREFNHKFIPIWLKEHPDRSKVAAGLACGFLWTVSKGFHEGDIVLTPDGTGKYRIAEVAGPYHYHASGPLPHRRNVIWLSEVIDKANMSDALRRSAGSAGTVSDISKHAAEIEKLIGGQAPPTVVATDPTVEEPSVFALEKHLEDFLVQNWKQTELGKNYEIFYEGGEPVGQQYPTDTGPIDILAVRKDKKELLVVELKRGRATDVVLGQTQRYMGYVLEELAENDQSVRGVIIALEDDIKLRRALAVASNISFYRYEVSFKLFKA